MELEELLARAEINDLLTRYTVAVDTRDFDALYEVFTPDAVLDYSSPGGPVGPPEEVVPWIERGLAGFSRFQHMLGQVQITFGDDLDHASVLAYLYNPMVATRPDGTEHVVEVGGYYRHEVVRTDSGWRSRKVVDDTTWFRGF